MSELPELPRMPRRVRPLPTGGLDAAVRSGRRRRNTTLGAVGGAGMAGVAVLVVALSGSTGGGDVLLPAHEGTRSTAPAAPTAPQATAPQAAAQHRQQVAASAAAAARGTSGTAGQPPVQSALPLPARSPSPTAVPTAVARQRDSYRETPEDVPAPDTCRQGPTGSAGPVQYGGVSGCSTGSGGPSSVRRGGQVSGTADICVPYGGGPASLGYSAGREHDVVVSNAAGDVVYRFSDTVTFIEGAHRKNVGDGRCLEWTGTWDTRTTAGVPVPPGRYDVKIILWPSTVNGQRVQPGEAGSSGFSVTVQ